MRLVKSSLALLAFVAVVWVAVLVTWRVQGARMPGGDDLVIYLVGLPLLLLAAYVVLRKLLGSMLGGGAARNASAAATAAAGPGSATATSESVPALALPIAGLALRTSHGDTPDALLAASRTGARPSLDTDLVDDAGYPQFAGRVASLDTEPLARRLADLGATPDTLPAFHRLRAMALLAEVIDDLRTRLVDLPPVDGAARPVRVSVLIDAAWADADTALLRRWLTATTLKDVPGVRWMLDIAALPSSEAPGALTWIAREARAWQTAASTAQATATPATGLPDRPVFWLIASADSFLDQGVTDAWAGHGRLHGAANPQGLIAGEASAALLLALPGAPTIAEAGAADTPVLADVRSRDAAPSDDALVLLTDGLLAAHSLDASAIVGVASDADHRRAPLGELSTGIATRLPDLAIDEACVPIGQACGHTGGTAQLASLVMAAHLARTGRGPALAFGVTTSPQRSAALVIPASPPPPAPAA